MSTPPQAVTPPSKKRKTCAPELLDVASTLRLSIGARLQVKWNICDDDNSNAVAAANTEESTTANQISVWWAATLRARTAHTHTLTEQERDELDFSPDSTDVVVPVYELDYDPLPEHGFEERAVERVAFVGESMLLNLNSEEIMIFRREGDPSPPSSPSREEEEEDDEAGRHLTAAGISELMDEIMESSLRKTGVASKLAAMPMAMQLQFAEKVQGAKERLYEKLMGEMERVHKWGGERVINGEVVRRCLSEMGEAL